MAVQPATGLREMNVFTEVLLLLTNNYSLLVAPPAIRELTCEPVCDMCYRLCQDQLICLYLHVAQVDADTPVL